MNNKVLLSFFLIVSAGQQFFPTRQENNERRISSILIGLGVVTALSLARYAWIYYQKMQAGDYDPVGIYQKKAVENYYNFIKKSFKDGLLKEPFSCNKFLFSNRKHKDLLMKLQYQLPDVFICAENKGRGFGINPYLVYVVKAFCVETELFMENGGLFKPDMPLCTVGHFFAALSSVVGCSRCKDNVFWQLAKEEKLSGFIELLTKECKERFGNKIKDQFDCDNELFRKFPSLYIFTATHNSRLNIFSRIKNGESAEKILVEELGLYNFFK